MYEHVNVFQGNSKIKPEPLEGIAASWKFIKGLSGNTHPGALLPFGKISVGAYSGGYPTGYGNNKFNCGEPIQSLYEKKMICGISHIHHNGTGAVGFYYNYAVVAPLLHPSDKPTLNTLVDEEAHPGYYAARFLEKDVRFALTTDHTSAFHRYEFPADRGHITVDFSNDGLYDDSRVWGVPGNAALAIIDPSTVCADVELRGIVLHFTLHTDSGKLSLWHNDSLCGGDTLSTNGKDGKFGVLIENAEKCVHLTMTISLKSREKSIADNQTARQKCFDQVRAASEAAWRKALSIIDIEADDRNKEIFYSNLYHSLVKPTDWSGESIYYADESFVTDFTTLWDIYKTQLPLLFTTCPDISKKIIETYINLGKSIHLMPNLFGLSAQMNGEAQQARFLAGYLFCDAYYRGVEGIDWNEVLDTLVDSLLHADPDFFKKGACARTTHTLDLSEACINISNIAKELNRTDVIEKLAPYTDCWKHAFDEQGLLLDGYQYYEGNRWNYSFRPMNHMDERMAIAGGTENFVALLDRFFGFTQEDDQSARFEGFNNETDMEAPYAYAYAGRLDRLAEVVTAGNKYMFTTGEGGVPGNLDSGGLSACYLWNALGVFPISGQNLMAIGMPYFRRSTITLANGNLFQIVRHGNGAYVTRAVLNGKVLPKPFFSVTDLMNGGVLALYTEEAPVQES